MWVVEEEAGATTQCNPPRQNRLCRRRSDICLGGGRLLRCRARLVLSAPSHLESSPLLVLPPLRSLPSLACEFERSFSEATRTAQQ